MSEIATLKALRAEGLLHKEIAKRLARPVKSVANQCYARGFVKRPWYSGAIKRKLRELVKRGNPDTVICLKLKLKPATLIYLRRRLGLRANRKQYYDRFKATRPWPVCFGCDARSPIMVETGWTQLTGWSSEVQHAAGATVTVTLCPACRPASKEAAR